MTLTLIWFVFPSARDRCAIVEAFEGRGANDARESELPDTAIRALPLSLLLLCYKRREGGEGSVQYDLNHY